VDMPGRGLVCLDDAGTSEGAIPRVADPSALPRAGHGADQLTQGIRALRLEPGEVGRRINSRRAIRRMARPRIVVRFDFARCNQYTVRNGLLR